jgi:hypothetical protein
VVGKAKKDKEGPEKDATVSQQAIAFLGIAKKKYHVCHYFRDPL